MLNSQPQYNDLSPVELAKEFHGLEKNLHNLHTITLGSGSLNIYIPAEVVPHFKALVQRGSNTFERAPRELKEWIFELLQGFKTTNFETCLTAEELNHAANKRKDNGA